MLRCIVPLNVTSTSSKQRLVTKKCALLFYEKVPILFTANLSMTSVNKSFLIIFNIVVFSWFAITTKATKKFLPFNTTFPVKTKVALFNLTKKLCR